MKLINFFTGIFLAIIFGGCAASTVKKSDVKLPKQTITTNITQYSVPLQKLGDMIYATGDSDIYIVINDITNKTLNLGKVPEDITGMLKTAFLNMGYKVHVFYSLDAVKNMDHDVYVIEGEISEFEQTEGSGNSFDIGLSASKGDVDSDLDYSNEAGTQVFNLSLDLRVLNAITGEYIPFVFAKNKIRLVKRTKSKSISFFIFGNGFGMSGNYTKENGIFSSLRLLAELSSVELIGKLKILPYWMVLPNGKPDYQVINNYKRKFRYFQPQMKRAYIEFLLKYYYPDLNGKNFNRYLILTKKRLNLFPADVSLTPELFSALLIGVTKHSLRSEISNKRKHLLNSVLK